MKGVFMRMWGSAILIGLSTGIGLFAALLGDGIWDWLSAVALSVPVAVMAWLGWIKPARRSDSDS